jgi:hypothetical protein
MPHLKCQPCRVRVQQAGDTATPVDLCPVCRQPLEPVADLADLVGYRWVGTTAPSPDNGVPNAGYERLAASVAEIMARRRVVEGRARLEAKRWAP